MAKQLSIKAVEPSIELSTHGNNAHCTANIWCGQQPRLNKSKPICPSQCPKNIALCLAIGSSPRGVAELKDRVRPQSQQTSNFFACEGKNSNEYYFSHWRKAKGRWPGSSWPFSWFWIPLALFRHSCATLEMEKSSGEKHAPIFLTFASRKFLDVSSKQKLMPADLTRSFITALEKKGETQRGCFNTEIATMITGSGANGCHSIPDTIGSGRICLCDTELCNSSHGLYSSSTTAGLLLSTLAAILNVLNY